MWGSRTRRFRSRARGAAAAAIVALAPACESVPLMSPSGAHIVLQVNPPFVPSNGGRALVTAVLTEPAGTYVPDGTVAFLFTSQGTIERSVETVNGIARAYFVSDARSGHACITLYTGGAAPAPVADCGASGTASAQAAGDGSATVVVDVGSALPERVILAADPQRILSPGRATLVATVYDASGNPVQNVPVVFTITAADTAVEETLDSGGRPQYTDSNGQAFDTLRTRALPGAPQKVTQVSVTVPGIDSPQTVSVYIN